MPPKQQNKVLVAVKPSDAKALAQLKKAETAVAQAAKHAPPKKKGPKKPPSGFFADLGEVVGTVAGGAVNAFTGENIVKGMNKGAKSGRAIGGHVATITGMGAYHLHSNTLGLDGGEVSEGTQVPRFSNGSKSNRICKSEFIRDLVAASPTTAFDDILSEPVNPTNPNLFPWMSRIAINYQKYRFHGLIFFYKTMSSDYSADMALGTVVMATNYNVLDSAFTSKVEMEQSDFATSLKPSRSGIHPIECDPNTLGSAVFYTRCGADPTLESDSRLYDMGLFQVALCGLPGSAAAASVGELWVSYDLELIEPFTSPADAGAETAQMWAPTDVSQEYPLGTTPMAYNPQPTGDAYGPSILGSLMAYTPNADRHFTIEKRLLRSGSVFEMIATGQVEVSSKVLAAKTLKGLVGAFPEITGQIQINGFSSAITASAIINGYIAYESVVTPDLWYITAVKTIKLIDNVSPFDPGSPGTPAVMQITLPDLEGIGGVWQSTSITIYPGLLRMEEFVQSRWAQLAGKDGLRKFLPSPVTAQPKVEPDFRGVLISRLV